MSRIAEITKDSGFNVQTSTRAAEKAIRVWGAAVGLTTEDNRHLLAVTKAAADCALRDDHVGAFLNYGSAWCYVVDRRAYSLDKQD